MAALLCEVQASLGIRFFAMVEVEDHEHVYCSYNHYYYQGSMDLAELFYSVLGKLKKAEC